MSQPSSAPRIRKGLLTLTIAPIAVLALLFGAYRWGGAPVEPFPSPRVRAIPSIESPRPDADRTRSGRIRIVVADFGWGDRAGLIARCDPCTPEATREHAAEVAAKLAIYRPDVAVVFGAPIDADRWAPDPLERELSRVLDATEIVSVPTASYRYLVSTSATARPRLFGPATTGIVAALARQSAGHEPPPVEVASSSVSLTGSDTEVANAFRVVNALGIGTDIALGSAGAVLDPPVPLMAVRADPGDGPTLDEPYAHVESAGRRLFLYYDSRQLELLRAGTDDDFDGLLPSPAIKAELRWRPASLEESERSP